MSDAELGRFAQQLMTTVRDRAIVALDHLASGRMRDPIGRRVAELVEADQVREAFLELIPEAVDQVLFEFLRAADNEELDLAWQSQDGSCIQLEELGAGEMAGWLMGSDGWRHRYSRERASDPFLDARLPEELDDADEE